MDRLTPNPYTLLHVESGRHLYGGALQVQYLLEGLAARGHRNILVCPEDSAIAGAAREVATVYALPMGGDLDWRFVGRLRRLIRAERPDLVHLHSRRGADTLGGLAARLEGVPTLLTRRVDNPEPRWWVGLKYRLYDHVVTISEGIRQVLLAEGLAPERVTCVHSAVDTERYRPGCDGEWFRREFGLAEGEPAVGVVAQLIERKGHRTLLDALPRVVEANPDLRVLLFGQGPLREELEAKVHTDGLEGAVTFAGFRDDLERVLPCLDAVVHPAEMEGLGVSLLQAAACAVPIVTTPVGGIPEAVHDGENGLLVPPRDAAALADALLRLIQTPGLRVGMGQKGRHVADTMFSIDAMVAGNLAVYKRLCQQDCGSRP